MTQTPKKFTPAKRFSRGFVQTGGVLGDRIRKASETRGFAESRLLTQWSEFAGETVAAMARPVKVSYARKGFGATLTLLCSGATAKLVEMQAPEILKRVNACYGYAAISRIRVTQTSAVGFAEAQATYKPEPVQTEPPKEAMQRLSSEVDRVESDDLRAALAMLGKNVLMRQKN